MSTSTNQPNTGPQRSIDELRGEELQEFASNHAGVTESPAQSAEEQEFDGNAKRQQDAEISHASILGWATHTLPTLLVMGILGGLGYFGHHSGWTIPKFSQLVGTREVAAIAWCEEHGVPEAMCVACNADLMPKGKLYGWCKDHGVHECVLHHPDLVQLSEIPNVSQTDFDRATRVVSLRPRTKNDSACKMHLRRIQFPSRAAADKAGIDINLVDRGRVLESVSATGEIVYNPTLVARLASRAVGTVWRVEKNVGERVKEGDVLALVNAAEVGRTKAELLQSVTQLRLQQRTYERLSRLGTVVAGKRTLEAETAAAEADVAVQRVIQQLINLGLPITYEEVRETPAAQLRDKLQFLGLPPDIVTQLDPLRTTSNLIPVVSPRAGVVLVRDIVAGEAVDTTKMLFTVADTGRMWLVLNVPLEEAQHVAIGHTVVFRPDGSDHVATATLTWISTDVDIQTRTIKVRGELANENRHLRNETFGVGQIILRDEDDTIVVPSAAVHWEGCCHIVFVRDKDYLKDSSYKVFHTRSVRPGVVMDDYTEVIAGLCPGEVVVTKGSGVLRAELLKGNLGAG